MSKSKTGGGIENELKYVLDLGGAKKVLDSADKLIEIRQAYLFRSAGKSARIRESKVNGQINYEFTFKQKIAPGISVELDNQISQEMFSRLSIHAVGWLRKTRAVISGWDIDVFRDQLGTPYFLMAEIEMPENQKFPNAVLPLVGELLMYSVTRGDGRFSSRKLGNIKYAKKLMRKIKASLDLV